VLDHADAWPRLHRALDGLDARNVDDLARRAQLAREVIFGAALPADLVAEISAAYTLLKAEYGEHATVAVRSSATAEDLPTASFAGRHESFLNISGEAKLLDAVRRCFASLFTDRGISYRVDNGFDHFKVFQSVGVMKMVRSDRAASGVIFTPDTETGFRDAVFITGAYGLGENVVQGIVDPDEFYVFKPTFRKGHRVVLGRRLGGKEIRMVYAKGAGRESTRNVPTPKEEQMRFCVSDDDVMTLADAAIKIEDHYSRKAGRPTPMDIEWAKDRTASCTSCRPVPKRWLRKGPSAWSTSTGWCQRARCAPAAGPSEARSPPARPASSPTWRNSASSCPARCSSRTPPCPTGVR